MSTRDKDHPANHVILILDVQKKSVQNPDITVPDYGHLIWSPQGHRFVFASNAEFFNDGEFYTSLWVHDVDQQQSNQYPTKITPYNYNAQDIFDWASTGLYMVVGTNSGIDLFDWASRQINPLTLPEQLMNGTRWSPDGTKLAVYPYNSDTGDIYIFNPVDKTFTNLTHTPDEGETFLGWRGANQNDSMIGPCGET